MQVSIEPAVTNKKVCRYIFKKLRETFGEAECRGKKGAYDGEKSFFTSGSLNFNSKEFPVFLDDCKGATFRPGDRGGRPGDSLPRHSPPPGNNSLSSVTHMGCEVPPYADHNPCHMPCATQGARETRRWRSGEGRPPEGEISW